MNEELNTALVHYVNNPDDSIANFNLALHYDQLDQYAAALSFYLRAAEFSDKNVLSYEALIRAARTVREQNKRDLSEEGLLRHAISICPEYCEGYFLLSRYYRRKNDHHQARTYAEQAELRDRCNELNTDVEYPGRAAILFEKALAQWNTFLYEQARETLYMLKHTYRLAESDYNLIANTMDSTGFPDRVPYTKQLLEKLKVKFTNSDLIERNYSKHMQDIFVLTATNGKYGGTYLEIGSHHPIHNNNTYLLESQYDWTGISIDNDQQECFNFSRQRTNRVLCEDATKINYTELLKGMPRDIDYLQVDVDEQSLEVLSTIPFDKHRFAVLQFEHDQYRFGTEYRDRSRDIIRQYGYILAVNDIEHEDKYSHEDWWIHPELVDYKNLGLIISDTTLNNVVEYFYNVPFES